MSEFRTGTKDGEPLYTQAEMDAALKDANRYKFMRDNAVFKNRNGPGLYWYLPRGLYGDPAELLDKAIDDCLAILEKKI